MEGGDKFSLFCGLGLSCGQGDSVSREGGVAPIRHLWGGGHRKMGAFFVGPLSQVGDFHVTLLSCTIIFV